MSQSLFSMIFSSPLSTQIERPFLVAGQCGFTRCVCISSGLKSQCWMSFQTDKVAGNHPFQELSSNKLDRKADLSTSRYLGKWTWQSSTRGVRHNDTGRPSSSTQNVWVVLKHLFCFKLTFTLVSYHGKSFQLLRVRQVGVSLIHWSLLTWKILGMWLLRSFFLTSRLHRLNQFWQVKALARSSFQTTIQRRKPLDSP